MQKRGKEFTGKINLYYGTYLSMDFPATETEFVLEKMKNAEDLCSSFHCNLCDTEIVHKIAQVFLPGLATACVDNTTGDLFKNPGSVAADIKNEMIDYLTQRSENFVAEYVVLEGGPEMEASNHPYDIIAEFVDDFASSKQNLFGRVSGWLLSEKREDKIDDFVQEMEINGFWLLDKREEIAQTFLKNVDFRNSFHCDMKFDSSAELSDHVINCGYVPMNCVNEGCNNVFCANQMEKHDSACPFKIIPCEQKCSDYLMRREMDRHCITVCPMKLVNCPFYAVGCNCSVPRSKLDQHCSEDLHSHILYIVQRIHKDASTEDLKQWVEQLDKSSSGHLAEAKDGRSLAIAVKALEANLALQDITFTKKAKQEEPTLAKEEHAENSADKTQDCRGNSPNEREFTEISL